MAQSSTPTAYFTIVNENKHARIETDIPVYVIGRDTRANLRLPDDSVALAHAVVNSKQDQFYIAPRLKNTVVSVNGKAIEGKVLLRAGDVIQLGDQKLIFCHDEKYDPALAYAAAPHKPMVVVRLLSSTPIETPTKKAEPQRTSPALKPTTHIYMPQKPADMLPGRPFWMIAYAVMLAVMGGSLVYFTFQRVQQGHIDDWYGSPEIGSLIIVGGLEVILVAVGILQLSVWGWWLARLNCFVWIVVSITLWIHGFQIIRPDLRTTYALGTLAGLLGIMGYDWLTRTLSGTEGMVLAEDLMPNIPGITIGNRTYVTPTSALLSVGMVGIAVGVAVIVMAISSVGMFVAVGMLLLEPNLLMQSSSVEVGMLVAVLVGGIVLHLCLLSLFYFDRTRFGTHKASI